MSSPKKLDLTVVIPTFNEEQYIARCLQALLNQEYLPKEILVVDNNSSDATVEIVKDFEGVTLIKEHRQGQIFARTTGFDAAKTKYIATVDADSKVGRTWARDMIAELERQNVEAISSEVFTTEGHAQSIAAIIFNSITFRIVPFIQNHQNLYGSTTVMTAWFWDKIRPHQIFRYDMYEDVQWAVIANKLGLDVGHLAKRNVEISIRRGDYSLAETHSYLWRWQRTYWLHGKKLTGLITAVIIYFIIPFWMLNRVVQVFTNFSKKLLWSR